MTLIEKFRSQLSKHGYDASQSESNELSREQLEQVKVGGGDYFDSFQSGPGGALGPFAKSIWVTMPSAT